LYILRYDEISAIWQLTMYTSVRARALFEAIDRGPCSAKHDKRRST